MNIPERIELFKKRIRNFVQNEVDALYNETHLIVKSVDIPCETISVRNHGDPPHGSYKVQVESVNARIEI